MKSQNRRAPRPEDVQEIETAWIPLSDGNRLAARIWLPACAKERQVPASRPPALKAIVTVGSTDDRYRDDMHFTGGCLI